MSIKYGMLSEGFLRAKLWTLRNWWMWLLVCIKFQRVGGLRRGPVYCRFWLTNLFGVDELNHELNHAIQDGLISTEVVETQKREETEVYKVVDYESLDKGDHDWYCFQCHLGGSVSLKKKLEISFVELRTTFNYLFSFCPRSFCARIVQGYFTSSVFLKIGSRIKICLSAHHATYVASRHMNYCVLVGCFLFTYFI